MRLYFFGVFGRSSQRSPMFAELLDRSLALPHRPQGVVFADRDAFHATLAGVGIDGNRQESAGARLALLGHRVLGRAGRAPGGSVELAAEKPPSLRPRHTQCALEDAPGEVLVDRLGELFDRIALLAGVEEPAQIRLDALHCGGEMDQLLAVLAGARFRTVSKTAPTSLTRPGMAVSGRTV